MLWLAAKKEEVFVCLAGGSGGRSETRYLGLRRAAHDGLGQKFWFFSTLVFTDEELASSANAKSRWSLSGFCQIRRDEVANLG